MPPYYARNSSLTFDDLLDAKVREFNRRHAEAVGTSLGLLAMRDVVFGFENEDRSSFKNVNEDCDDQTNEHVILID